MGRYVALLRGINVGGNNLIKMVDLKACFESEGFAEVATYIQSGNVLFTAAGAARAAALAALIERALARTFGAAVSVTLRDRKQMRAIVERAPPGFGAAPGERRYDVIFLRAPLSAAKAMASVAAKPGVDEAHAGAGVLYFSRLISKASQSQLVKLIALPIYKSMTIRNWNTTTALARMLA